MAVLDRFHCTMHACSQLSLSLTSHKQESDFGRALVDLHIHLYQTMEDKLVAIQKHLRGEFLWKKLLYGSAASRTEGVVSRIMTCSLWQVECHRVIEGFVM